MASVIDVNVNFGPIVSSKFSQGEECWKGKIYSPYDITRGTFNIYYWVQMEVPEVQWVGGWVSDQLTELEVYKEERDGLDLKTKEAGYWIAMIHPY